MRTDCHEPYQRMLAIAAVLSRPPGRLSHRHLFALAGDLAAAVRDLDARMRAGLMPPAAWRHAQEEQEPPETNPGRSRATR